MACFTVGKKGRGDGSGGMRGLDVVVDWIYE
jgi:hypothetical protein